jgi:DNA repair exonuclease SbcCD ATPase subunit
MSEALTADVLAHEPPDEIGSSEPSSQNGNQAKRPVPGDRPVPGREQSDQPQEKEKAKPGAYERAKERVKAQKAAQDKRDNELRAKEAALNERERAFKESSQPKPKQRDYTLSDLRKYLKVWSNPNNADYNPDLVDKAEAEIEAMEAEVGKTPVLPGVGSPEHTRQWQQAEQELVQADPEFMRQGTELDTRLRAIMQGPDGELYRQHPRGIVAAYHQAKLDLTLAKNEKLSGKIQELETELKRYQGLTGVNGGVSRRPGSSSGSPANPQEFSRMSTKDMKRHLLNNARGGGAPLF